MAPTKMTRRFLAAAAGLLAVFAIGYVIAAAQTSSPPTISLTLAGQSMIRSDLRETAPAEIPIARAC